MIINTIKSLTNLEIFLIICLLGFAFSLGFEKWKNEKLAQANIHLHGSVQTLYNMYMQLSSTTKDVVNKWQISIEKHDALLKSLLNSNKSPPNV